MSKKIQVTVDPYAQNPETTASEISSMAKAMVTGAGAEVIRDANGKVVQVVVGVPDFVADGTVGNAANAIGAHGGVAVVKTMPVPALKEKSITTITEGTGTLQTYSTLPDGCMASLAAFNYSTFTVYSSALAINRPTGVASNVGPQLVDNQWYYGKINMTGDGVIPDPAPTALPLIFWVINYSNSVYGVNLVDVNVAAVNFKLDYATDVNNSNVINISIPGSTLLTTDIIGPQEPIAIFYIDQNGTGTRMASFEELITRLQGQ